MSQMKTHIRIKLFVTLKQFEPDSPDSFPIEPGTTIKDLIRQLGIPEKAAKLVFVNGIKQNLTSILEGGESVGIFPPVGGG